MNARPNDRTINTKLSSEFENAESEKFCAAIEMMQQFHRKLDNSSILW